MPELLAVFELGFGIVAEASRGEFKEKKETRTKHPEPKFYFPFINGCTLARFARSADIALLIDSALVGSLGPIVGSQPRPLESPLPRQVRPALVHSNPGTRVVGLAPLSLHNISSFQANRAEEDNPCWSHTARYPEPEDSSRQNREKRDLPIAPRWEPSPFRYILANST